MILAIDIGNTNIVLGCMERDRILVEARMATDLLKTSDQYCVELTEKPAEPVRGRPAGH